MTIRLAVFYQIKCHFPRSLKLVCNFLQYFINRLNNNGFLHLVDFILNKIVNEDCHGHTFLGNHQGSLFSFKVFEEEEVIFQLG